jgi:hypothetical protein
MLHGVKNRGPGTFLKPLACVYVESDSMAVDHESFEIENVDIHILEFPTSVRATAFDHERFLSSDVLTPRAENEAGSGSITMAIRLRLLTPECAREVKLCLSQSS